MLEASPCRGQSTRWTKRAAQILAGRLSSRLWLYVIAQLCAGQPPHRDGRDRGRAGPTRGLHLPAGVRRRVPWYGGAQALRPGVGSSTGARATWSRPSQRASSSRVGRVALAPPGTWDGRRPAPISSGPGDRCTPAWRPGSEEANDVTGAGFVLFAALAAAARRPGGGRL